MKIYASQLPKALQQPYACYLLFGKEPTHIQLSAETLTEHFIAQGYTRSFYLIDNLQQFDWSELQTTLTSPSLFAPKQWVDIYFPQLKLNKQTQKILSTRLQVTAPETRLLIRIDEVDAATQKTAWWKHIEAEGLIIHHPQLNDKTRQSWIQQYAKKCKHPLSTSACQRLHARYKGDLLRAKQALDLLSLLPDSEQAMLDTWIEQLPQAQQYAVFELCDYALNGQIDQVHASFQAMTISATQMPLLIWQVHQCLTALHSLITDQSAFNRLGIWSSRQPFYYAAQKRVSATDVMALIQNLGTADQQLKNGQTHRAAETLERVLLHLAGAQVLDSAIFL